MHVGFSERSKHGQLARSRREEDGRVIVQIAGVTSAGSHGVAHWLDSNVSGLYEPAARSVSAVVDCDIGTDLAVTDSRAVAGPYTTRD